MKYAWPPFDGKAKNFQPGLQDFYLVAIGANLLDHLQEGAVEIPVNSGRIKSSLCQQYPPAEVELSFHACNFLSNALVKDDGKKNMKRADTPQGAVRELKRVYPESAMQPVDDMATLCR